MKKKIMLPVLALMTLATIGCGKDRNCECVIEGADYNYNPIMVVDHGMKCEDITEMSIEEKYVTESGEHSVHHVDVHNVHCHEQRR
ncbi:MAG: hypothetical protein K6E96_09550 [Bacteroidales bacterium]|nr:hypothetical protein [Bacteroidales bacterium]